MTVKKRNFFRILGISICVICIAILAEMIINLSLIYMFGLYEFGKYLALFSNGLPSIFYILSYIVEFLFFIWLFITGISLIIKNKFSRQLAYLAYSFIAIKLLEVLIGAFYKQFFYIDLIFAAAIYLFYRNLILVRSGKQTIQCN